MAKLSFCKCPWDRQHCKIHPAPSFWLFTGSPTTEGPGSPKPSPTDPANLKGQVSASKKPCDDLTDEELNQLKRNLNIDFKSEIICLSTKITYEQEGNILIIRSGNLESEKPH